jgi:hypothetical protein
VHPCFQERVEHCLLLIGRTCPERLDLRGFHIGDDAQPSETGPRRRDGFADHANRVPAFQTEPLKFRRHGRWPC